MPTDITVPQKGFTKSEKQWLEQLIADIKTCRAIAGDHCQVSDGSDGQTISADDCPPC